MKKSTSNTKDKEVLVIEKKISPIAQEAQALEIASQSDLKKAVVVLSKLNQFNDQIRDEKEKVTKPLNEALRAERGRWKPIETMYEEAIDSLRTKMSAYQTKIENERKAKQQAIVNRIGAGKGNLSLEKAVERMDSIEKVEKEIATEQGLVQFRTTKTLKIVDENKIPDKFWMINEKLLLDVMKAGLLVEGAEIVEIQTAVNYR